MQDRLPLFPLGTVLVPGLVMPLHVFEPRYRRLVADLLARPETERELGVVAIRSGREVGVDGVRALYGTGTSATLREVTPYDDGRSDIVTTGHRRFRLLGLDGAADTPYLTGLVEWLDEPVGDLDPALPLRVQAAYRRYGEVLGPAAPHLAGEIPDDPQVLSYLVTTAMVLPLSEKQRLLEQPDTAARLRAARALLKREVALVQAVPSLPLVDVDALRTQRG